MTPIVPALIPKDEYDVIKAAGDLAFSREFHLDIVDSEFAGESSWPVTDPGANPESVGHTLRAYSLEVDLMVPEPQKQAKQWLKAGTDRLVFHVETISLEDLEQFAADSTASVGVAMHGVTPLETFIEYALKVDFIQLMGIRDIGSQGQPFDDRVLEYIKALRQEFPAKSITVDGSVNADTIAQLSAAGADRFIAGSAIMGQENKEQAWRALSSLINHDRL